jgi:hypothetical protein
VSVGLKASVHRMATTAPVLGPPNKAWRRTSRSASHQSKSSVVHVKRRRQGSLHRVRAHRHPRQRRAVSAARARSQGAYGLCLLVQPLPTVSTKRRCPSTSDAKWQEVTRLHPLSTGEVQQYVVKITRVVCARPRANGFMIYVLPVRVRWAFQAFVSTWTRCIGFPSNVH